MNLDNFFRFLYLTTAWLAFVGLLALIVVYLIYQRNYRYWRNKNVPATNPKFPLGDASQVGFFKNFGVAFKEIYDRFEGERFNGMWVFYRPYLMVRDPDLIRVIFVRDFGHFRDRGLHFDEKADPLSANLFFMGGPKWRNLRAKLSSTFSSGKMKKMFDVMSEKSSKLQEILSSAAERKAIIEPKEYAVRYTHDVVASSLLGLQADCIFGSSPVLLGLGKKVFEPNWSNIIRNALNVFVPTLASFFQVTVIPKMVGDFFLRSIKDVMEFREKEKNGGDDSSDFIGILIKLKNQGYTNVVDVKDINGNVDRKVIGKFTFTNENAVAQAFIFWFGAFESSATTMQFALYEMSLNNEIQERAREEVKRVLAEFDGKLTYESLAELKYLGRLVDETLRKYPPVPILTRICLKAYQIPDSDVIVEKGVPILISVLGLHMDPKYYPDPEKFDPDRFTEEEKRKRHHYAYLPFGEGLHQCLGQRYARMQIKVGLANLLDNYKFEIAPKTPRKPKICRKMIIYSVENGIPLKISKLA